MKTATKKTIHRTYAIALAAAFMTVAGCNAGTGAVAMSLSQLDDRLAMSPTRTEVELYPDTLTAREMHVEADELIIDDEYVESTVTAVSVMGDQGTLTLALGGIEVAFDASARFRLDGSPDLSLTDFVDTLSAELAAGATPFVRAERASTGAAADPFDPTFIATEVRIEDTAGDPKLELVLDAANLEIAAGATQGILRVLGLEIVIATDDGTTFIEDHSSEVENEDETENEVEDGPGHG